MELKKYPAFINKKYISFQRWFALGIIVLHIVYVNMYSLAAQRNTISHITGKYKSLFAPAEYTFGIWILIYLALLVYGIMQVLPKNKKLTIYDDIALPLMISLTFGIWWAITYHFELIGISMVAMLLMLVFAFMVYKIIYTAIIYNETSRMLLAPFSLYLGWIAAATFLNFNIWLNFAGMNGLFFGDVLTSRLFVVAMLIIAIAFSFRYWDFIIPLTFAWAFIGIYTARLNDAVNPIGMPAFIGIIILIIWSLVIIFIKKTPALADMPR